MQYGLKNIFLSGYKGNNYSPVLHWKNIILKGVVVLLGMVSLPIFAGQSAYYYGHVNSKNPEVRLSLTFPTAETELTLIVKPLRVPVDSSFSVQKNNNVIKVFYKPLKEGKPPNLPEKEEVFYLGKLPAGKYAVEVYSEQDFRQSSVQAIREFGIKNHLDVIDEFTVTDHFATLVEYVSASPVEQNKRYFMTTDTKEIAYYDSLYPSWKRTGWMYKVWPGPCIDCFFSFNQSIFPSHAVGVCRFEFNDNISGEYRSTFYTADPRECDYLRSLQHTSNAKSMWRYQGISFYALPIKGAKCEKDSYPLYRTSISSDMPNHRWVAHLYAYSNMVEVGWQGERASFCVLPDDNWVLSF